MITKYRLIDGDTAQLRSSEDGRKVAGYVSVWGTRDKHGTVFERGAFGPEDTVPLIWNHVHSDMPVGQVRVFDDEHGRAFEGELFTEDLGEARALSKLLASGAVRDCSHGFLERSAPDRNGVYGPDSVRMIEVTAALPHTASNPAAYIQSRASLYGVAYAFQVLADLKANIAQLEGVLAYGEGATPESEAAAEAELAVITKMLKSLSLTK